MVQPSVDRRPVPRTAVAAEDIGKPHATVFIGNKMWGWYLAPLPRPLGEGVGWKGTKTRATVRWDGHNNRLMFASEEAVREVDATLRENHGLELFRHRAQVDDDE